MNMEQLQDEIVACRLEILHQYFLKGIFPIKDLLIAINCINVDCESLERCRCREYNEDDTLVAHFQIPQLISYYGKQAIEYIGSTDRRNKFQVITSLTELENKQYKKRTSHKPYVWIDFAPNNEGMLDCFVFNAPMLKQVSVVGIFKDPRQVERYHCCKNDDDFTLTGADDNMSYLTQLVKERLTAEKLKYYRQYAMRPKPNDQTYNP